MRRSIPAFTLLLILSSLIVRTPETVFAAAEDYVWQRQAVLSVIGADDLKQRLAAEVEQIINRGHLEPGFFSIGLGGNFLLWGYPGELPYTLSLAYPYLSAQLQQSVKTYLAQEIRSYSPVTMANLYNNGTGWGGSTLGGNRREYYPVDSELALNVWPPPQVPLDGLYMIWAYAEATGDWQYVSDNWSAIVSLFDSRKGTINRYGQIGGLIGTARLADRMSQAPWNKSNAASVKSDAASRAANALTQSDFAAYAQQAKDAFTNLYDWVYPVFCFERGDTILVGCFFPPEVGRYLRDSQLAQVRQAVEYYIGGAADYADSQDPGWFMQRADYAYGEYRLGDTPAYGGENIGSENSVRTPDYSWTWFMTRANIFRDDPQVLRTFLDVPTMTGDLYYVQKLVTAIEAHGQVCWEDLRTPTSECQTPLP